jgi:hyperosmotically inducible protein
MKTYLLAAVCWSCIMTGCGDKDQGDATTASPAPGSLHASPSPSPEPSSAEGTTVTKSLGGPTVTPIDQGTGESDTSLTLSIRRALVSEQDLSLVAKNVTIVAREGNVILRGDVPTTSERDRVEAITRKIAGPKSTVDDQIDVKSPR